MAMLIVSRTIVYPANDRCLLYTGEASVLRHTTTGNCRFDSKPGVENLVIGYQWPRTVDASSAMAAISACAGRLDDGIYI